MDFPILYNLKIDLDDNAPQKLVIRTRTGDHNAHRIRVELYHNSKRIDIVPEATATLWSESANGTRVYSLCEVVDNGIEHVFTTGAEVGGEYKPGELDCPGEVKCELFVTTADSSITVPVFRIYVDKIIRSDDAILSGDNFPAIADVLSKVTAVQQQKMDKPSSVIGDNVIAVGDGAGKLKSMTTIGSGAVVVGDGRGGIRTSGIPFSRLEINTNKDTGDKPSDDIAKYPSSYTVSKAIKTASDEAVTEAKAYANTKIAEEVTARDTGDAATLVRAKTYADEGFRAEAMLREAGDADTLASAKAYANSKVSEEATARNAGDVDTLARAKAYADGKNNDTIDYIDDNVAALEGYINSEAAERARQLALKQNKLRAGANIVIDETTNTISAGGGGGGTPTVTIDVSQFISENQVQLTDEQYDILTINTFVKIDATAVGLGIFGVQCGLAWSGVKYAQIITAIWDTPNILSGRFSVFEFADNKVMTIMQDEFPTTSGVQEMIEEYVGVIENGTY